MALLQADGRYDMELGALNKGDSFVLFHGGGVNSIGPSGTSAGSPYPNTNAYQNGNIIDTEVTISNISASGQTMTFDITLGGNTPPKCGCYDCTIDILNTLADEYSCMERIDWLIDSSGYSEFEACRMVAGQEFPSLCGPNCDPETCDQTSTTCNDLSVQVSITTDSWPFENFWKIETASDGELVAIGGPFSVADLSFNENLCIDESICYTFTILDSYGDGIADDGDFSLTVDSVVALSNPTSDWASLVKTFGNC